MLNLGVLAGDAEAADFQTAPILQVYPPNWNRSTDSASLVLAAICIAIGRQTDC